MTEDEQIIADIYHASELIIDNINISSNDLKKFRIKSGTFTIKCKDEIFTSISLNNIAYNLKKYATKYRYCNHTIILDLTSVKKFADKNTYLILDLLVYYILYRCKKIEFHFNIDIKIEDAITNGIRGTALFKVCTKSPNLPIDPIVFFKTYSKSEFNLDGTLAYYRRILLKKKLEDTQIVSKITTEVSTILNPYFDEEWCEEVNDIITETADNAHYHNSNFLLIDMDICEVISEEDEQCNHKSLNISVLNIGDNLIYEKIRTNIKELKYKTDDPVYKNVYKAYDNHKSFFDEQYKEEFFFTITAFQKKVTSRTYESGNSGTGLTNLIQNIINKTEKDYSYVLSGDMVIRFKNKFLNISKDGLIGFNNSNNYLSEPPDREILFHSGLFVPGTVYYFHLIRRD